MILSEININFANFFYKVTSKKSFIIYFLSILLIILSAIGILNLNVENSFH
jgi:hypothetical protein